MGTPTTNLALIKPAGGDPAAISVLNDNFDTLDAKFSGAGGSIPTAGIEDLSITTGKIAANAVTAAKIPDGEITAAKIANRTRSVFIPAGAFQLTSGTPAFASNEQAGHWLLDAASTEAVSTTSIVPGDWATGTIVVHIYLAPVSSGSVGSREVVISLGTVATTAGAILSGGAGADTISTDDGSGGLTITAHSRTITVNAGEMLGITVARVGGDAADDLASDVRFFGVRLDYTADG